MFQTSTMFRTIVLPLAAEAREIPPAALQLALKSAVAGAQGGPELHLLAVIPGFSTPLVEPALQQVAMAEAVLASERRLRAMTSRQLPAGWRCICRVMVGSPTEQLLSEVRRLNADLIVLDGDCLSEPESAASVESACFRRIIERADCTVIVARSRHQREAAVKPAAPTLSANFESFA